MASRRRAAVRRIVGSPVLLILVLAPYFGEGLSGSTPPLELFRPWNLAFMAALYGCGALICREVAHRFGLGFIGLCLLGAAYGVWEEALVDRYWFFPTFWAQSGVGSYSVVWHTNVLLAVHLTAFHTAISICSSVIVVEWLRPRYRSRPWVGRPGLSAAAVVLAVTPVIYGEFDRHPPAAVLVSAAGLVVALVVAALWFGRRVPDRPAVGQVTPRRGIGVVAFVAALAHWVAVYGIAETKVPAPVGVVLAVVPVLIGVLAIRRLAVTDPYGVDGVRAVVGLVAFFVLLDAFVGLQGQYDLVVGALLTAVGCYWLRRSARSPAG